MKIFSQTYYVNLFFDTIAVLLLLVFALLNLISFSSKTGQLAYSSFVVQSGSMEPTIAAGDIILIKKQLSYQNNSVVTFLDASDRTVTHRIISQANHNNQLLFNTKGDANRTKDNDLIKPSQILGKVFFVLPRLGFLVVFSRTFWGLLIFVAMPASIIVIKEIINRHDKTSQAKSSPLA